MERLSRLSGVLIALALSLLPVFLLQIGEKAMVDRAEDRFQQRWETRARSLVQQLQAQHTAVQRVEAESIGFWRRVMSRLSPTAGRLRGQALPQPVIERLAGNQLERFPQGSLIYVFSAGDEGVARGLRGPNLATAGLKLLEPLVTQLIKWQDGRRGNDEEIQAIERRTRSLFGDILRFTLIAEDRAGKTVPIVFQNRRYHLFWNTLRRQGRTVGAMLVMVPRALLPSADAPLQALLHSWKRTSIWPVFYRRLPDSGRHVELSPPLMRKAPWEPSFRAEMRRLVRDLPAGIATSTASFLAFREPLGLDSPFSVTILSRRSSVATSGLSAVILLFRLFIGAGWALYFSHVLVFGVRPSLPLQPLFAILLLLVAGLPIAGGLVLGGDHWQNLSEQWQRDRLEDIAQPLSDLEVSAQSVVTRYSNLGIEQLAEYSRLAGQASNTATIVPSQLGRIMERFREQGLPLTGIVISGPGDNTWRQFATGTSRAVEVAVTDHFTNISLACLQELEPSLHAQTTRRGVGQQSFEMTRQLFGSSRHPSTNDIMTTGQMFTIAVGKAELLQAGADTVYYLHLPLIKNGKAEQMAFLLWKLVTPLADFFRRQLPRIGPLCETTSARFGLALATPLGPRPLSPPASDRFWSQPDGKLLLSSFRTLPEQGRQVSLTRGPWLLSLLRSGHDPLVMVGAIAPRDDLLRLAQRSRQVFLAVTALLIGMVVLLGVFLGRRLLVPIQQLDLAVHEVGRGNLAVRLEIPGTDEPARLGEVFNEMIRGLQERRNLGRFVSGSLDQMVGQGAPPATAGSDWKPGTVLVSDIRGFTTISEMHPPPDVLAMLNHHLDRFSQVIRSHGGLIQQFIGDAVIAVFWENREADHRLRALTAAIDLRRAHAEIQADRQSRELFSYDIGIGLSSGELLSVILGTSGERLEHLVFGDPLETAERLESASRHGTATRVICSPEIRALHTGAVFHPLPALPDAWELTTLEGCSRPPGTGGGGA